MYRVRGPVVVEIVVDVYLFECNLELRINTIELQLITIVRDSCTKTSRGGGFLCTSVVVRGAVV